MVRIPGGAFLTGSDLQYPEEGPAHPARVDAFDMDATTVTNAQFAAFVAATGHVTVAERPLDPTLYPGAEAAMLAPGALVFRMTEGLVDTRDISDWWHWTPGAQWRAPEGPGSTIEGREDHPAVQVAFEGAAAYARWACTGSSRAEPIIIGTAVRRYWPDRRCAGVPRRFRRAGGRGGRRGVAVFRRRRRHQLTVMRASVATWRQRSTSVRRASRNSGRPSGAGRAPSASRNRR